MTSGVPQGSILAPLLFPLYQNNLSNTINHSKIATFADDTKIYKVINTELADAYAMENDLANFQSSSTNANLLLNTNKCKALRITRKHNKINHTYKLQDSTLKTTDCERDLGVWTSSILTLSKQVLHQCAQASKSLGFGSPRSKSRPSLFVEPCILHSFVPTSRTLLRSGLHDMLTSSSVQNAFKDVRRSTY